MRRINLSLRYKAVIKILLRLLRGERHFNYYFPKNIENTFKNKECFSSETNEKFAIVLQGPYIGENNFTIETLRRYRKNFPNGLIILSTWSVPKSIELDLQKIDVKIILNKMPQYSGFANVNLQIVSSREGLLLAKKLGAKYALKTRTDQRIHNPNFFDYMLSLLKTFPLEVNHSKQHSRLIACSLNTFKLRMFGISDMFLFGEIDDVIRYWNVPLDNRDESGIDKLNTWRLHAMKQLSEVYFCTEYLRSIGADVVFTLESSLRKIVEHFIIVDQNAIGLFWDKYTYDQNRYDYGFYDPQLSFNDWLNLYSNLENITFDESMLDRKIGGGSN